jgi:hypothetical protein
MDLQIINLKTGELKINDFLVSNNTSTDRLEAHFDNDLTLRDMQNGYENYSLWNIKIGELYFIFTFYFFNKVINKISFVLNEKPYNPNETWDDFNVHRNIEEGKFMEKWLINQIQNNQPNYNWGKVYMSYDHHNLSFSCSIDYTQNNK